MVMAAAVSKPMAAGRWISEPAGMTRSSA